MHIEKADNMSNLSGNHMNQIPEDQQFDAGKVYDEVRLNI